MISLFKITEENYRDHLEGVLEVETLSFSKPWSAAGFAQEICNPLASLWAAVTAWETRGFVCYWVLDFEIHLLDLAVHPGWRHKGIGRLLLGHMIEEAVSKQLESIWLEVRVSNASALALYEKFGFEQVGVRSKYYDDTQEDALVMRLTVPGALSPSKDHAYGGC
jgi:[ribosomal protein S18]-alanine N-acetyltransferase